MSQSFTQQLEILCRRRRHRRVASTVCWALAAVLAIGLVLVGLDWLLGIADPAGRWTLTATFLAATAAVARFGMKSIREHSETDLQVAYQLEAQYPELRDILGNAWEFAHQSDADSIAGSTSLRRAVVLRAASAVDQIEWERMIPRLALRRGLVALGGTFALIAMVGWCMPDAMATGFARLIKPFQRIDWPREYDLQFVDPPTLIAAGEDLILRLRDTGGKLPRDITVHYRVRLQDEWRTEEDPLVATGNELEIARASVQQSLEYRAVGGDHTTMPWQSVEVVAPPRVSDVAVTVSPPAYTELPPSEWSPSDAIFAGSQIQLTASVDRPIKSVCIRGEKGREVNVTLSSDGRTIQVDPSAWRIEDSDRYQFHLTTLDGVTACGRQEIAFLVTHDQPPHVRLVRPLGDLRVMPTAIVPVHIVAKDELGVREVSLAYRRSDRSQDGDQRVTQWKAAPTTSASDVRQTVQTAKDFDLSPLSLAGGSVVEIRAQADDAQPMTGQSNRVLRLTVVGESQLWEEVLQRHSRLVDVLLQARREQRELRESIVEWTTIRDRPGDNLTNTLHGALFRQRVIADTLGAGQHSALQQIGSLIATVQLNQLVRPEFVERLEVARLNLQQLLDDPLAVADESISETLRQVRREAESDALQPLIERTLTSQTSITAGLNRVIENLAPGNVLGRLERRLAEIDSAQRELAEHCQNEIAGQVLQPSREAMEIQNMLIGAVGRQRRLSGRLASFLLELSQTARRLADAEPLLAARFAETGRRAEALSIHATMQAAAEHLRRKRVGRAAAAQQRAIGDLAVLRDVLAGRNVASKRERLAQLRQTERQLQRLRSLASDLESKLKNLTAAARQRELERLQRQRDELARQTEKLSQELERLSMPKTANLAGQAARQLQRGRLDGETAKQARQKLDAAQRALTAERRRHQVALAQLQMAQLDAKLKSFVGLQQSILEEVLRLDRRQSERGELDAAEQQSVALAANRQATLREDVAEQADTLEALPVFAFLLNQSTSTMRQIEEQLQLGELGQATQDRVAEAIQQLFKIVESLQKERQAVSDAKQQSGGGDGQKAGDTPQAQTLQLALGQLKLLRTLQADLRDQTDAMERAVLSGQRPERSAAELAQRQQQLAELAERLVSEPLDPPAEAMFPNLEQEIERSFDDLLQEVE